MDVVVSREHDAGFDEAAREAELVPCRYHPTGKIQVVVLLLRQRDLEGPVAGRDRRRVVPLLVVRLPVVQIDRFPIWVVSGVERTAVDVELVTEDQLPCLPRNVVDLRTDFVGRAEVDETPVARHRGDLTRRVNSSQVESAEVRRLHPGEIRDERVSSTEKCETRSQPEPLGA